ncbi:MAG TPA: hypothetical protein VG891_09090 [Rhizomicrobium sp.]|nr:hypothetical protein [Rhizomicrobium sp.]
MPKKPRQPGIKLQDVWGFYDAYNKSVNEISRQVSYAGIALIWVFKISSPDGIRIPKQLFVAAFLLGLCIVFDFLQYVIGSITYQIYGSYKEKRVSENEAFQQPNWLLMPMDGLFFLKITAAVAGYVFILEYLNSNIHWL